MKIHRFDCIGRVPSSIEDLKKCEMCLNEEICMGLSTGTCMGSSDADVESHSYYQHSDQEYSFNNWKE